MKSIYRILLLSLIPACLQAQEFSFKSISITPEQIIVHYDLQDTTRGRTYMVFLYTSKDNFISPVAEVSGDVGIEVKPGLNRRIVWNSKQELGPAFNGDIELEIRGRVFIPFIQLDRFQDAPIRKRATPFLIKWSGGSRLNVLNFQLYNSKGINVYSFPNVPNESQYKLVIPRSVKPGKGYYFRITDTKNKDEIIVSPKFEIRRKYPLVLKAVPLVAVGALIYFTSSGKTESDLEEPPLAPLGKN